MTTRLLEFAEAVLDVSGEWVAIWAQERAYCTELHIQREGEETVMSALLQDLMTIRHCFSRIIAVNLLLWVYSMQVTIRN